jgi:uncharacterized protein (TIGR01244 family)
MTKYLVLILSLVFGAPALAAEEHDFAAVSRLKVDLDAVTELRVVKPVDGITAAGQPDEAGFKVFAENGYVAVIDLRTKEENRGLDEPAFVESLGMEYVAFPISADDITLHKARELDRLLGHYDAPVLVHCASSNRVGALLALRAFNETGDAELALEIGKAGGMTRLENTVKEVLEVKQD